MGFGLGLWVRSENKGRGRLIVARFGYLAWRKWLARSRARAVGGLASCARARGFDNGVASLDFWRGLKLKFKFWFWWIKMRVVRNFNGVVSGARGLFLNHSWFAGV